MNAYKVLAILGSKGVNLQIAEGKLRVKAERGVLTEELKSLIKSHRDDILTFLEEQQPQNEISEAPARDDYPLSSQQRQLYFLQQLHKDSTLYNMPRIVQLDGSLETEKIEKVFQNLIQRHEILRTGFVERSDEPRQEILNDALFRLEHYIIKRSEVQKTIDSFVRPFELSEAPLIRVGLVSDNENEGLHLLMVDQHHIVTDGVSQGVLVNEFMKLYEGEYLAPLNFQYKDYAYWQQGLSGDNSYKRSESFWQKAFMDEVPVLYLPTDFERPIFKGHEGDLYNFSIDQKLYLGCRQLADRTGSTMYMLLLSVFNILLSKLGNQEDIVIGTPVAGRQHSQLESMIGMFVNTLPVRNFPEGSKKFLSFLEEVRARTLSCFDHQSYPYEELVESLRITRDPARNPLFDVVFTYQNFERPTMELSGMQMEGLSHTHRIAKFDLTLLATEGESEMHLNFEYSKELFNRDTIARFARYFIKTVEAVITNPEILIRSIGILDEQEQNKLIYTLNASEKVSIPNESVCKLIKGHALNRPDLVAIAVSGKTWTYKELNVASNQLAQVFLERNNGKSGRFALLLDPGHTAIIAMLAVLKLGGTYLPLSPEYSIERLDYIVSDAQVDVVVGETSLQSEQTLDWMSGQNAILIDEKIWEAQPPELDISTKPQDLFYIIYTSGTTGQPKGVEVREEGILNMLLAYGQLFNVASETSMSQVANLTFDAAAFEIWPCLAFGGSLHIAPGDVRPDPWKMKEWLKNERINITFQPTAIAEHLLQSDWSEGTTDLRFMNIAGDRLNFHGGDTLPFRVYNLYGPTEDSIWTTWSEPGSRKDKIYSIGKPICNKQVFVVDQYLNLQPIGVSGELCIAGPGLAKGYVNNDLLTREKFVARPWAAGERMYRTGDKARWLPDGEIEFQGRIDEQIKIRGFRIEPAEIEYQLLKCEGITEVKAMARIVGDDKQLVAYLVAQSPVSSELLGSALREKLPAYMIPSFFVQLERMPVTARGKLDKNKLPLPVIEQLQAREESLTPIESLLKKLWSEVLNIDKASILIKSNFFELGGHSLKSTILINKIFKATQVAMPLREVFERQDIQLQAAYIETATKEIFRPIPLADEMEYFPSSSSQRRMYFLYQYNHQALTYNIPQSMRIRGGLNLAKFENALNRLVARHESLRTVFLEIDHEPYQKILEQPAIKVEYFEEEEEGFEGVFRNFVRPFDLAKGPLLRVGVMFAPGKKGECVLLLDQHHIITDGTSNSIFLEELIAIYEGKELPDLPCQYKDYAVWQRKQADESTWSESREFWLKEYQEIPEVLRLPYDFSRPSHRSTNADRLSFEIGTVQTKQLLELAKSNEVTVFTFLLSVLNVLLAKLSNQEDIVIGTPVNGRQHADLAQVIGLFINTLPIRNRPEGAKSFRTFLKEVQEKSIACQENQMFPYDQLIEMLRITAEPGTNPLFETMFSFQNFEQSESEVTGLEIESLVSTHRAQKFDLTLGASESKDKINLRFEYSTDLFQAETIQRFAEFFKTVLSMVLVNPDIELSKISLMTNVEREEVLLDFNATNLDFPEQLTIPELFEKQARETPDQIALSYNNQIMTYSSLDRKSDFVALGLLAAGVKKGDVIAVLLPRGMKMILALVGILKAGAAYLPLNAEHPIQRRSYMIANSEAKFLVGEEDNQMPGLDIDQLEINTLIQDRDGDPLADSKSSAAAYIIYTSGSTGKPKGVSVSQRNLVNLVFSQQHLFQMDSQERILQFSNLVFDASMEQIWLALLSGSTLVLVDQLVINGPERFVRYIEEQKISHLHATPSYLEMLDLESSHHLLRVVSAGEPCPPQLATKLGGQYQFFNKYGPSETTVTACMGRFEKLTPRGFVSIGKPICNTRIYILDKQLEPVPIGSLGELFIAGEGVSMGYVGEKKLTNEVFMPDPFAEGEIMYRSGDMGRWLPDGEIEYVGRKDHQVKIRGHRIEMGEVNHHLSQHALIVESVVAINNQGEDQMLVGYYVSDAEIEARVLVNFLSDQLPAYMIPAAFVHLAEMPRMVNGKVDFSELRQIPVLPSFGQKKPETEVQTQLLSIFSEVLKSANEVVSIDQGFFDLGGHSLRAMQLMRQVNKAFHTSLDLASMMTNPSIEALADIIEKRKFSATRQDEFVIRMSHHGPDLKNVFFVHDVSGDILGYMELASYWSDRNCWGLRSTTLGKLEPVEADVRSLAQDFIKKIKLLQPEGPYELVGWSMGGTLVYEIAFQLEANGDVVSKVIMIDSKFPRVEKGVRPDNFALDEEKKRLATIQEWEFDLEQCQSMQELWERSVGALEATNMLDDLYNWLPVPYQHLISSLDVTTVHQIANYVNTFRSLQYAIAAYVPVPKLNAPLLYIKAKESKLEVQDLAHFFSSVEFCTAEGDHFTILKRPNVGQVFKLISDWQHGQVSIETPMLT